MLTLQENIGLQIALLNTGRLTLRDTTGSLSRLAALVTLLGTLIVFSTSAQTLPIQTFGVKDGLVSQDILTLYQDSEGFLWAGTPNGISMYDGWTFVNYTAADGLAPGGVRQILEGRTPGPKVMWVLTFRGALDKIINGKVHTVSYDSTTPWAHRVLSLWQDREGIMWAATEDTIATLVNDQLHPVVSGIRMKYGFFVGQGDSVLWIGNQSGLVKYSYATRRFTKIDFGSDSSLEVNCMSPDNEGNLWINLVTAYPYLNEKSLLVQVRGVDVVFRAPIVWSNQITRDDNDNLWLATSAGLRRITTGRESIGAALKITVKNGLSDSDVRSILVDREKNLWLGTQKGGIAKLTNQACFSFTYPSPTSQPYHYSDGAADSNGHIWVISAQGLREFWNEKGAWDQALSLRPEPAGSEEFPVFDFKRARIRRPSSVFCDHQGRLWVGFSDAGITSFGVHRKPGGPSILRPLRSLRSPRDFPAGFPLCFIVDRAGRVWYCVGGPLLLLDPAKAHPLIRSFPFTSVRALVEDNAGNIWAGTFQNGLFCLEADSIATGSFKLQIPAEHPADQNIASIRQTTNGTMVISDEKAGLTIAQGDTVIRRTIADGLPSSIVRTVVEDIRGRFWVGTASGVALLDSLASPVIHPKQDLIAHAVLCSGTTRSGLLWFVTLDGLSVIDPREVETVSPVPPIVFTGLKVNGRESFITKSIELPHDSNTIDIGFAAITFKGQQEIAYRYRLLGAQKDWGAPTKSRSITLAQLAPGDYTFEVQAGRFGGVYTQTPIALRITILPPFWGTWWFRAIALLLMFVAVGGTIRYVEMRKLKRHIEQLESERRLERERARISRDMHDEVGATLTQIVILSEVAKQQASPSSEPGGPVDHIAEKSREVIDSIGEIIWAINPNNDSIEDLVAYLRQFTMQYFRGSSIVCRFTSPESLAPVPLSAEARRNVFLVCKEAMHNVMKHSGATELVLSIRQYQLSLEILIEDNGKGLAQSEATRFGNGLKNMERRMEEIGGSFVIDSGPGRGTRITLTTRTAS